MTVLQVGLVTWEDKIEPFNNILNWVFSDNIETIIQEDDLESPKTFDVILLTSDVDNITLQDYQQLLNRTEPYAIIFDAKIETSNPDLATYLKSKYAQSIDMTNQDSVIYDLTKYFFKGQYGDKLKISDLQVSPNFSGSVQYLGNIGLELSADFGQNFQPVVSWRYNIMGSAEFNQEIWLEYQADSSIQTQLCVYLIQGGTSNIINQWVTDESSSRKPIVIETHDDSEYYLAVSLKAKGQGELTVGNIHSRRSRKDYGQLILGGQRHVDECNQEIFSYFHPGNMKPPLNVYFSGYRTAEGFEGFWMMKKLGHPFLLISDPRLEGGSFYLGSKQLEDSIINVIHEKLDELGYTTNQLIMSGLSMGTFGALYYGSQIQPRAIIVGKPLVNLGNIARNEKIVRPGLFGTSLDLLLSMTGGTTQEHVNQLNQRFWHIFNQADFDNTLFAIAYMKNDDYDQTAYTDILDELSTSRAVVIGKGINGRHNDDSFAVNQWFISQFQRILTQFFDGGN